MFHHSTWELNQRRKLTWLLFLPSKLTSPAEHLERKIKAKRAQRSKQTENKNDDIYLEMLKYCMIYWWEKINKKWNKIIVISYIYQRWAARQTGSWKLTKAIIITDKRQEIIMPMASTQPNLQIGKKIICINPPMPISIAKYPIVWF